MAVIGTRLVCVVKSGADGGGEGGEECFITQAHSIREVELFLLRRLSNPSCPLAFRDNNEKIDWEESRS